MRSLLFLNLMFISLIASGCTAKVAEYFTLGKQKTVCEENGCDYGDAGVCDSPYNIIQHKVEANKQSYTNIACGKVAK